MNNRDFILVGAGAVVGYLLVGIMNKNKAVTGTSTDTANLPDTSSQTLPPATTGSSALNNGLNDTATTTGTPILTNGEVLTDPRTAFCEDNWVKYSMSKRFGSQEQAQTAHDSFISNCLATRV